MADARMPTPAPGSVAVPTARPGLADGVHRFFDSDVWFSFKRSPITIGAAAVTLLYFVMAVFGPWIAPHDPFDLAKLDLLDSLIPPAWMADG